MFFNKIKQLYNEETVSLIKNYVNINNKIRSYTSNKEFLLKCRSNYIYHNKINNVCNKFKSIHFFITSIKRKQELLLKKLKCKILNLEIKDIYLYIKFLTKCILDIVNKLSKILTIQDYNKQNKFDYRSNKKYFNLSKKFENLKNQINNNKQEISLR